MHSLLNISLEKREKICHDLSLEFAKFEYARELESGDILTKFEPHERLLCHYALCYKDLMENFDKTLDMYKQRQIEALSSFLNG